MRRSELPPPPLAPPPVPQLPEEPRLWATARLPMPQLLQLGPRLWVSSTVWRELAQELPPLLLLRVPVPL